MRVILRNDEDAQIHILEMLTLFGYSLCLRILIRIDVQITFVAHDASLEAAGESVLQYGLGLDAELQGKTD